jgi:hypothetical protein
MLIIAHSHAIVTVIVLFSSLVPLTTPSFDTEIYNSLVRLFHCAACLCHFYTSKIVILNELFLLGSSEEPTGHSPQPTVHSPRPTAHSQQPTAHSSQPTVHGPQPTVNSPQHTVHSPQSTIHITQSTAHSQQPTAHSI